MQVITSGHCDERPFFGMIYGGIAVLALVTARVIPVLNIAPDCAFRILTGWSCPTCGSTRSIVFLAHGEIGRALSMNPLVAIMCMLAVALLIYDLITLATGITRISIQLDRFERNLLRAGAAIVVIIQWSYLNAVP